jgi:hypothetical protein
MLYLIHIKFTFFPNNKYGYTVLVDAAIGVREVVRKEYGKIGFQQTNCFR